ncbi:MAG: D-glycero-beta-D-manno-heptose 1-phosphate adenylyltransferase [Flavobacteriales bacterium]|nr:MAG: D-glycero-beta-D-manno-heptose 1-phosphate adenylyltransferase [Flavobacteriales bacterium]
MSNHLTTIKEKVIVKSILLEKIEGWKSSNEKIVFTNGVFDILHRGHIEYLAQAASSGDKFIVAINADESVRQLGKGDSRPLQDENSRALIIAALAFVDAVIIFNDDTPFNLISEIIPDVLIKGGDYDENCTDNSNKKYIVGSDVVKNNNGKVKVIQFVDGYSTTKIEEKIKNN